MSSLSCSICIQLGKKSVPEIWCTKCGDMLCQQCSVNHRLSNGTKDHVTIKYDDFLKVPPFIRNIHLRCSQHEENWTYFCQDHEKAICKRCMGSTHKKCKETQEIEQYVRNVKQSAAFQDIFNNLESLSNTLSDIIQDRYKRFGSLLGQKTVVINSVEQSVKTMIDHLMSLKNKMVSEIDQVFGDQEKEILNFSDSIEAKKGEINEMFNHKEDILSHASNIQTFLGMKEMENKVMDTQRYLQELSEKGYFNETEILFQKDEKAIEHIKNVHSLWSITIKKLPKSVPIDFRQLHKAQIPKQTPKEPTLEEIFGSENTKTFTFTVGIDKPATKK